MTVSEPLKLQAPPAKEVPPANNPINNQSQDKQSTVNSQEQTTSNKQPKINNQQQRTPKRATEPSCSVTGESNGSDGSSRTQNKKLKLQPVLGEMLIIEVQSRRPLWDYTEPLTERFEQTKQDLWEEVSAALDRKKLLLINYYFYSIFHFL